MTTATTPTSPSPSPTSASMLKTVTRYEDVKNTATTSKNGSEMGKQDFLKLFTA